MHLIGEDFATSNTICITGSREKDLFGRYATEHPRREQALSAWDYLEKIYRVDSLFTIQKRPKKEIEGELIAPASSGIHPAHTNLRKLSDFNNKFIVVVFGASWCQTCHTELSQIANYYPQWKNKDVEVVFVSLDTNQQHFQDFSGNFPFVSFCDFKKWESPAVKAYHVFATPTIYLLDANRKIILRPNSVQHLAAWLDMLNR